MGREAGTYLGKVIDNLTESALKERFSEAINSATADKAVYQDTVQISIEIAAYSARRCSTYGYLKAKF
jgi:hypothetical protein